MSNPVFGPNKSFVAIGRISESCGILAVHPRLPVASVQDLVALAKATPNHLNYASAGRGSRPHLNAELFKLKPGIDLAHVPYKSGVEMITAIWGEQIQMAFVGKSVSLPLIRDGKLKGLANRGTRPISVPKQFG